MKEIPATRAAERARFSLTPVRIDSNEKRRSISVPLLRFAALAAFAFAFDGSILLLFERYLGPLRSLKLLLTSRQRLVINPVL